jgi:hypothetical protein
MNILLADFIAKVGREDISSSASGTETPSMYVYML